MATYKTSELESALVRKGYSEDKTHHKMYWYYVDGRKTALRTRTSNGEKEFDDFLFNQRRKQMGNLTRQQMIDFIECSFTAVMYRDHLVADGIVVIALPEPE